MTATTETTWSDPDRTLKSAHRSMWASGDYASVATEVIPDLGALLVEASGVRRGDRVLDAAAGSGNAAIPAALVGADVVAADLTPELFEEGRRDAARRGADVSWHEADVEALPFADGEFDKVLSCVGVMFAPHHQNSADELVRVCRPGGTIGLANWTPGGFVGEMFSVMRPYAPPPPPGAQPPPLWGDEDHVRALFGDSLTDVHVERRTVTVDCFDGGAEFRDFFRARYGPTIAAYRRVEGDPAREAELDEALVGLAARHNRGTGGLTMEWEYLLFVGRRTGENPM